MDEEEREIRQKWVDGRSFNFTESPPPSPQSLCDAILNDPKLTRVIGLPSHSLCRHGHQSCKPCNQGYIVSPTLLANLSQLINNPSSFPHHANVVIGGLSVDTDVPPFPVTVRNDRQNGIGFAVHRAEMLQSGGYVGCNDNDCDGQCMISFFIYLMKTYSK